MQRTLLISVEHMKRWVTIPIDDETQFRIAEVPILKVNPNYRYHTIVPLEQVINLACKPVVLTDDVQ